MLERLVDHPSTRPPEPFAGPDNPIRMLTRAIADGEDWTAEHANWIGGLFDGMASDWSAKHVDAVKRAPVDDALERGRVPLDGRWLEIGAGTGAGARVLAPRVGTLITADLSYEMLSHAPGELAPRVQSDAAALPFPANSFDALLLINMILFPAEFDRVLRSEGTILWVNTMGDQTPIHLPPRDVLDALPGSWDGLTASAGTGFWLTARRSAT